MTQELIVGEASGVALLETPNIQRAMGHYHFVQQVITKVMVEGTHFGPSFPGDKKKNLLKAGADALGVAFGLAPEFIVEERDLGGDHREYSVVCRIHAANGRLIATGVGSCSTKESKYRYRTSKRTCPNCGQTTIIKGSEEYGGGWLCWAKKGGCGTKWPNGAAEIESQKPGTVENPDPADQWNTCRKIAKKRAWVDTIITGTGVSDTFTQDAEDFHGESAAPAHTPAPAPAPASIHDEPQAAPTEKPKPAPAHHADGKPNPVELQALLMSCANKASLEVAWKNVIAVQGNLEAKALTALMKVKRDVEASFGKEEHENNGDALGGDGDLFCA